MTGYQSKKKAAQDKLEQWDTPSEAFNNWWDSDYDDSTNPYERDSFAYWAWAGWQAALAQPTQEPFGYLSIGGNPIFQKEKPEIGRWETLYTAPPQRPWVGLTDEQTADYLGDEYHAMTESDLRFFRFGVAAAKDKNT